MIYYNVTTKLDRDIEVEWINWMKKVHIPEILNTKKFLEVKLLKLILDDPKTPSTYAAQYCSSSKFLLNNHLKNYASVLRIKTIEKFGERALSFRTKLELISEHR